jgi:hypothetical protein
MPGDEDVAAQDCLLAVLVDKDKRHGRVGGAMAGGRENTTSCRPNQDEFEVAGGKPLGTTMIDGFVDLEESLDEQAPAPPP